MKKTHPAVTNYPSPLSKKRPSLSNQEKKKKIETHFQAIMETLGLDMSDSSLKKTPGRVARMFVEEVFSGLSLESFPSMTYLDDPQGKKGSELILTKVSFTSFCEHHFVPMHGYAIVAYIPRGKLIGISKIPRLVRYFASRPQLQERLTLQIADSLSLVLDTPDVAVSIKAEHFCVIARGIEDDESNTVTNVLRGAFEKDPLRKEEFFDAMQRAINCQR